MVGDGFTSPFPLASGFIGAFLHSFLSLPLCLSCGRIILPPQGGEPLEGTLGLRGQVCAGPSLCAPGFSGLPFPACGYLS